MDITDKEKSGCPKTCLYGEIQTDGSCKCLSGFYGTVLVDQTHLVTTMVNVAVQGYVHVIGTGMELSTVEHVLQE